jgi:predicted ATPase
MAICFVGEIAYFWAISFLSALSNPNTQTNLKLRDFHRKTHDESFLRVPRS